MNNAGCQFVAPIQDCPTAEYDKIVDTILKSTWLLTKFSLPYMIEKRFGRIINTGSMHATVASPYKAAYNAAKHGVLGLTKTVCVGISPSLPLALYPFLSLVLALLPSLSLLAC